MSNEEKEQIVTSLEDMSEQVGKVITEYHWRELMSISTALRAEWELEVFDPEPPILKINIDKHE